MARVLIVDDARVARRIMRNTLSAVGHEIVSEAKDGGSALKEYRRHKPDVVFMDVTMPGMDGIDASKQILAEDPAARIIMVTSINRASTVNATMQNGVAAYIVKPYHRDKVIAVVNRVLNADTESSA